MMDIKPWVYGPFELLEHAEGHLTTGRDFDKRIALISYDNAIEVAITTFLRLHPSQRGGKSYPRVKTDNWLANYHSKIDFFFNAYLQERQDAFPVTLDEVIWYHNLRNELYHSGTGMVPEGRNLTGARTAAISIFSELFQVDAGLHLKKKTAPEVPPIEKQAPRVSGEMTFLSSFIQLEKTLVSTLDALGEANSASRRPITFGEAWNRFVSQCGQLPDRYNIVVNKAQHARNDLVHGQPINIGEEDLMALATEVDEISSFVISYGFSIDILPELQRHYTQWLRPEIRSVRIVQRQRNVFLEILESTYPGSDEKITRTDLSFIESQNAPMFSLDLSAEQNAKLFVETLDPYSIINCTDLFTPEGCEDVAKKYGPRKFF